MMWQKKCWIGEQKAWSRSWLPWEVIAGSHGLDDVSKGANEDKRENKKRIGAVQEKEQQRKLRQEEDAASRIRRSLLKEGENTGRRE